MTRSFRALLLTFGILAGLLLAPASANAVTPAPGGSVDPRYGQFCAPGQQNCFAGWNFNDMSCVRNDDSTNSNIGVGIITGDYIISHYYQFILLRHWVYCGLPGQRPSGIVVGPGYCLRWIEYAPITRFNATNNVTTFVIFGVPVNQATHQGSQLPSNTLNLNRNAGHNYSFAAYRC